MISIETKLELKRYCLGAYIKERIDDNDDIIKTIANISQIRFELKSIDIYDECIRIKNSSYNKIII